jgi:diguanylate cyclase (GGDEF)-like protein
LRRWANLGARPDDNEQVRLRKAVLTIVATAIAVLAVFWGGLYVASGYPVSGAIPLGYAVISFISIGYYFATKSFTFFRFSQLLLILLLPFALMWSLGGFANGSVVMIWGFFAPLAALFLSDQRSALRWLLAFLALVLLSGLIQAKLAQWARPMPEAVNTLYFMLNMGLGTLLIYVVLYYFVQDRQDAYRKLRENEEKIRELMLTDPLTGIPNRRYLDQRLKDELNRRVRTTESLGFIMMDIDHFKTINDSFGHTVGDNVLKHFAELLSDCRRDSDFMARYGGEEFVLLLPATDKEGAMAAAHRVKDRISAEWIPAINENITASFGVTVALPNDTPETLIARADEAMYTSKREGRDRITFI